MHLTWLTSVENTLVLTATTHVRNEIYNLSRFKNHMEEDTLIQTYVTIKLSTGTLFTLSRFRSTHCKNNQVSNCFKSSGNIKRFLHRCLFKKGNKVKIRIWAVVALGECAFPGIRIDWNIFLCGISLGPLPGYSVVFCSVSQILSCYASHQRIRWIAVCKKRTNGEKNFGDRQCWAPVILQNIETDHSLAVDIAMIDSRSERHLGWLEGVVGWKCDI